MALDASIALAPEPAYGTAGTVFAGYEGKADSWKTSREFVESTGFRKGRQTARSDRRRIVDMGGEGEIECDVLDTGMTSLFGAAFDTHTSTVEASSAIHTFHTSTAGNGRSFTADMVRPRADGGSTTFRHLGCVATSLELSQEVGNPLSLKVGFDFRTVDIVNTTSAPVYPVAAFPYDWTVGTVEVKHATDTAWSLVEATKWDLTAALGLKVDRRFIRANPLKSRPVRAEDPAYTGTVEAEFTATTLGLYEAFVAGDLLSLRITYTGRTEDEDGTGADLVLTAPTIQFTGESPESSLDDLTTVSLPFTVLDPGTADALTLVVSEPAP